MNAYDALKDGPMYADFDGRVPVLVWVVEYADFAQHRSVQVMPFDKEIPDLVWALVEAMSVSRSPSGSGISVTFWDGGATGWFPTENVRLPEEGLPCSRS